MIRRWPTILARWTLGVVLVSWRYLWATTPLHRSVEAGDATDLPPPIPDQLMDDRSQPVESGVGPLFRRLFAVEIEGSSLTAAELIAKIATDLNQAMPSEVTAVERISGTPASSRSATSSWYAYPVPGMARSEWSTGPGRHCASPP